VGIDFTELGMTIEVKALAWNAQLPMEVTEPGMLTAVSFRVFWNADSPMVVTVSGMVAAVINWH
jgi:hypothetical protein